LYPFQVSCTTQNNFWPSSEICIALVKGTEEQSTLKPFNLSLTDSMLESKKIEKKIPNKTPKTTKAIKISKILEKSRLINSPHVIKILTSNPSRTHQKIEIEIIHKTLHKTRM